MTDRRVLQEAEVALSGLWEARQRQLDMLAKRDPTLVGARFDDSLRMSSGSCGSNLPTVEAAPKGASVAASRQSEARRDNRGSARPQ